MLTFRFFDADGMMTVYEKLTTGMVGKQAKLEFSAEWANRRKTAVFTSGSVTKDVLNVTDIVTIPHEVLQNPGDKLYVGIYGVSEDGTQITPTIYAQGPNIFEGADPSGDESTDVTLPVWAQLDSRVSYLEQNGTGGGSGSDSTQNAGLTDTEKNLILTLFRDAAYTSDVSKSIAELEALWNVHTHSYTSSVTTAATCETAGVRTYTCSCGDTYTEEIPATGHNYVDGVCSSCGAVDPDYEEEVTLTGISATYSGGDVLVGTALTDLDGIVVTANYSNGSTATVTDYTLSGEIADGENTITVSYGDFTTTFAVTGLATYTVTNDLTNVTNSNTATTATGYYSATLSAEDGYVITVNITMGGVDVTDSVYTEDGTILIAEVTGDIVITAVAELATAPVLYQLSNTPVTCNADLYEDTGLTFGSSSANGYTKAWTICVDAVVTTNQKALFGVNDSETNAKCLQFQTNGASNGLIYICNNSNVQSPNNDEKRHRFVITHAANAGTVATIHMLTDGQVVSTEVNASYGNFAYSGYAGNLYIGGKAAAAFIGTINEFTIYDGVQSDAHIAEFLGVA